MPGFTCPLCHRHSPLEMDRLHSHCAACGSVVERMRHLLAVEIPSGPVPDNLTLITVVQMLPPLAEVRHLRVQVAALVEEVLRLRGPDERFG